MNRKQLIFFALASELVFLELGFIYLGGFADKEWGWSGLGVAAGAMVGLALWLLHLFWATKQL